MSNHIQLNSDFITTIEEVKFLFKITGFFANLIDRNERQGIFRTINSTKSVEIGRLQRELILLDEQIGYYYPYPRHERLRRHEEPRLRSEIWKWLSYDKIEEIIPIYDDYIALATQGWIIQPHHIPNIIDLICVPKSSNGLDIENHEFGYHFHYGKIQKDKLIRSDLLLTFKPTPEAGEQNPNYPHLYAESHGSGYRLNMEVIGNNKRKPIYLVCQQELTKKNRRDFKTPGSKSSVFYRNT
ncbi:hypothetical protein [Pseudomonas sp. R45(2017)]|jgi:hypothetical protein|uniref:hypothetical protein n=1 Tax=Pseudomonas sp. R45(2017) TaxID=1981678 RepID=UPI00111BF107|nr:hypothetical protein [Pseudomonas sp. R45(2017)]